MFNEQELIQLLQIQDKRGISLIYDRYSAALYGVALRIVKSEAIAQDVLQDAFIKIWKSAPSYDGKKGTLFTWMLNITRNTAIDKTRSAHFRRSGKIQSIEDFVNGTEPSLSEEIAVEHIGVRKSVNNLEEKYQVVMDLVYFNGYTHQEAAECLNLPLGTVKSRVKIALRELRKIFLEGRRVMPYWLLAVLFLS